MSGRECDEHDFDTTNGLNAIVQPEPFTATSEPYALLGTHHAFAVRCEDVAAVRLPSGKLGIYVVIEVDWDELSFRSDDWNWNVLPGERRGTICVDEHELNDGVRAVFELLSDGRQSIQGLVIPVPPSSIQGLVPAALESAHGSSTAENVGQARPEEDTGE